MLCPHCGAQNDADARFCGACGRATAATEPSYKDLAAPTASAGAGDLIGREIAGRYRVTAKLGEGGMGAVYRGEQISLKRKVAIKVLRPELSADPGLVRRFNAEAELAAKLSHPNTVGIYDFGQDAGGALFIAMEYLEGDSLRAVVTREGPLSPARALAIARQIAASLADAHAHGIVHRDLKPDNVMLTERGRERDVVRVLDFGIAKLRDDNRATVNAMTRAGDLVGTPQYMAPEQIRGDAVDGRTDIYALGAILYEMVTGRLPFEGPTVMAVLSKHLTEAPPPPTARRPDLGLPPALDHLIMSALAKEPAGRPPSMELFAEQMAALAPHVGGSLAGFGGPTGERAAVMPVMSPVPGFAQASMPPGPPPPGPAPSAVGSAGGPRPEAPMAAPPPMMAQAPMMAQPLAQAPMMAPPQGYQPYPPLAAPTMVTRRGSLLWLWILLGVLAAGGVAAAVLLTGKDDAAATTDDPPTTPTTPTTNDWPVTPGSGTAAPAPWRTFRQPDAGWRVELPPELPQQPIVQADGTHLFQGFRAGVGFGVAVYATPGDASLANDAMFAEVIGQMAVAFSATIDESGPVDDGSGRYRASLTTATGSGEVRIYTGSNQLLVAVWSVTGDADPFEDDQERFFQSVVVP